MSETTRISWTDATWNPWQGCRKVSAGCKNCYAERLVRDRMGKDFREIRLSSRRTFYAPVGWAEARRIFTCSISDFFIEEADTWRSEAWDVIRRTPRHTYQILTKRPERIPTCLPDDWGQGYPNVWLGTSVENDAQRQRIDDLSMIPARVRFLSCEPLLDSLSLEVYPYGDLQGMHIHKGLLRRIDWVIVGGESGPDYREMKDEWALNVLRACRLADVPFFFKQHSGPHSEMGPALEGREYREMPKAWSEAP